MRKAAEFLSSANVVRPGLLLASSFLFAVATPGGSIVQPKPPEFCPCVELETAIEGFSSVSRLDWEPLDRAQLVELWPTASADCVSDVQEELEKMGFEGRCCRSCGTCAGQLLVEAVDDPSIVSLQSIGAMVCRESPEQNINEVRRLIDAVVPASVEASEHRLRSDSDVGRPFTSTHRWRSRGETFLLDASVSRLGEHWIGSVELTRCEEPRAKDKWVFDDGSSLDITSIYVREDSDGKRWLSVTYVSQCLVTDKRCLRRDERNAWLQTRAQADRDKADIVVLDAETCGTRGSEGIFYEKNDGGKWVRMGP